MAVVKPYPLGEAQARPMPTGLGGGSGSAASFGPVQTPQVQQQFGEARDLQVAGAQLERASSNLSEVALGIARDVNESRVQELNNQFISAQQSMLYTGDNAFYRQQGRNAIDAAPAATQQILDLKKSLIDQTSNQYQKDRLTRILDSHVNEVTNGMSRFVAAQSIEWQKSVADGKSALVINQARLDNNDFSKVAALAATEEENARAKAKAAGVNGTPAEEAMIVAARSKVFGAAIDQAVQSGDPRRALAMYNNVKDRLDGPTNDRLSAGMKSIATMVDAENWIADKTPGGPFQPEVKRWGPQVQQAAARYGVDPVLALAVLKKESEGNPTATGPETRSGKAKGLMQIVDGTARDLGITDPYNPDQSINGGVQYLSQMLAKYGGDQRLGLMAYNWGPANVDAWLKAGARPDAIPAETRDYVQKVQGFVTAQQGVGYDKAAGEAVIKAAMDDPSLSPQVRTAVTTMLQKQISTTEAARTATIKGLDDQFEAVTQLALALPGTYKKGTLDQIAAGYEAVGDKSKAVNARMLAAMEETLLNYSGSSKEAQEALKAMLQGKAKELASAFATATARDATDAGKLARDELAGLKTAADAKLNIAAMEKKARAAVDLAMKANDRVLAQNIIDFYDSHVRAQAVGQAPPLAQQQAINDMRSKVEGGSQANADIETVRLMQQIADRQTEEFKKDPMDAGSKTYPSIGSLAPLTNMNARIQQADFIDQQRGTKDSSPYTVAEAEAIRQKVETSDPLTQAATFSQIAATVPARMIPKVAAQISGKGEGDPYSRSLAAALSFFAEKDPTSREVAGQILQGAKIQRDLGEAGKKAPTGDKAWQSTLQERHGNVFRDMGTKVPAVIADAIASVYTYQMHRAGRQGESTVDTDILDAAAKAVLGTPIERKGQYFLPPVRGMGSYEVDRAIRSITDGDLEGLRTTEGDQITAEKIINNGMLSNAGPEGMYFVRIPDPRAGWDPRPIVRPDGTQWQLDLRPLIERSRMFQGDIAPVLGSGTAPRVAPLMSPQEYSKPNGRK